MKTILCFTLTLITIVTIAFVPNSSAQDDSPEYVVRVIYFLPNDRQPDPNIDETLETLIKDLQMFYADRMEEHGFERKTFRFEADNSGNVVVHHVNGKFDEAYYRDPVNTSSIVWREIEEQFDMSKNIYLLALDTSGDTIIANTTIYRDGEVYGLASANSLSGTALIPVNYRFSAVAHEFGHAFGLLHSSYRPLTYEAIDDPMISSFCAAEWMDKNRYFNLNHKTFNLNSTIEMLPPTLVAPPATIRLQFEITDPDGLHQVQLYTQHLDGDNLLITCQRVSGTSKTVDFEINIPGESVNKEIIGLRIIDAHGNYKHPTYFPIDVTSLLPDKTISIPDPGLEREIRTSLELSFGSPITQKDMLGLTTLEVKDVPIKELTGIEYAINLRRITFFDTEITDLSLLEKLTNLDGVYIYGNKKNVDISPLEKLTKLVNLHLTRIPNLDISPLEKLTKIQLLTLAGCDIADISPLEKQTKLGYLDLNNNNIIDISQLEKLTNLETLRIRNNQISDVSPLVGLVNLKKVYLQRNPIKNRKPLLELLRKNPDVEIYISNKKGEDHLLPVTLSHFQAEHTADGVILNWTTESEVDNAGFYIYRSETKEGEFKVVNPTMIQGAGTTAERSEYTWTDSTAKPNTVYYYRIEDVSHAGEREQLATVRLRGLISASGKLTIRWANMKM